MVGRSRANRVSNVPFGSPTEVPSRNRRRPLAARHRTFVRWQPQVEPINRNLLTFRIGRAICDSPRRFQPAAGRYFTIESDLGRDRWFHSRGRIGAGCQENAAGGSVAAACFDTRCALLSIRTWF